MKPGQRNWALAFEASDDYGVAAQCAFAHHPGPGQRREHHVPRTLDDLHGTGAATLKRLRAKPGPGRVGPGRGDDLIVQFSVDDNARAGAAEARAAPA